MTRADRVWAAALMFGMAIGVILLMTALGGCAAGLAKGYEITKVTIDEAYSGTTKECNARAVKCIGEGAKRPEDCPPAEQCRKWLRGLTAGRNAAGNTFATVNEIFDDLERAKVKVSK